MWPLQQPPPGMGVKRSLQCGGTLLGLLANIFTVLSTATNYWIRFPMGHGGLWQDCTQGACSNMPCQCFGFLLVDMILQSTDAISGFPVCL
ncbi:Claudin domain-containing protein 2 [Myotis davidii]|uniref:Claudin domain-containing protein 2 n=1 Tax=Myotis davidii TaxID=225400 RepID=L5MGL6_MYODS|nr:Claudin domain-containing protein 2 [Myotis davidii]